MDSQQRYDSPQVPDTSQTTQPPYAQQHALSSQSRSPQQEFSSPQTSHRTHHPPPRGIRQLEPPAFPQAHRLGLFLDSPPSRHLEQPLTPTFPSTTMRSPGDGRREEPLRRLVPGTKIEYPPNGRPVLPPLSEVPVTAPRDATVHGGTMRNHTRAILRHFDKGVNHLDLQQQRARNAEEITVRHEVLEEDTPKGPHYAWLKAVSDRAASGHGPPQSAGHAASHEAAQQSSGGVTGNEGSHPSSGEMEVDEGSQPSSGDAKQSDDGEKRSRTLSPDSSRAGR